MQKKRRQNIYNKVIANLLVIVFILVSIPMDVFAEEINELISVNKVKYEKVEKEDKKILQKTENKTIYQLDNGLKREVLYDGNVRFYEGKKLVDYDPSLVKIKSKKSENNKDLSKYAYENMKGDKKNYLPKEISEDTPVLLENNKYNISISPVEEKTKSVSLKTEETINIYDETETLPLKAVYTSNDNDITLEYISQDNGVKENLILNEKPESNVFEYEIMVDDNLIPQKCEIEESIVFNDKDTDETKASIDFPYMNDKTGKAYCDDITYNIEESDKQNTYILTMTLSEDYLNDKDRVYPVTVDPTITWTGESNFIDTYILSNSTYADTNFYDSGTTAFPIGYTTNF